MAEAAIGLEVLQPWGLDGPWRMTVDYFVADKRGERIERYQLTGSYEKHERDVGEIASVQTGAEARRHEVAEKLDALDREYGRRLAELTRELQREQVRVLHGDAGVALLDQGVVRP